MQLKRNKEMEFERLKKSHKKQIIIGALAICVIGGALTFATTRAKYKLTQDLELAKGTINYKPYDFKVMAMYQSENGTNYTEINDMPSSGYIINEEKTYCTTDNKTEIKGKIKTENGKHVFENLSKSDKCYLYFDKESTILVGGKKIEFTSTTPDFTTIATTDEGVYKVKDGMYGGYSYYWRGAAMTNHVIFANKCWRIVRINGDGSIRLIYSGSIQINNTCAGNGTNSESIPIDSEKYNSSYDKSEYAGWTYTEGSQRGTTIDSLAKEKVEEWYNNNIGNNTKYDSKIVYGNFCNDRNLTSGSWSSSPSSDFYYAAYNRINSNMPTLSCSREDIYVLKVGMLTADEVMYAGGHKSKSNTSYYLYKLFNNSSIWTMTPAIGSTAGAKVYVAGNILEENIVGSKWTTSAQWRLGFVPVINLTSNVIFSTGDGTMTNPYVVSTDNWVYATPQT